MSFVPVDLSMVEALDEAAKDLARARREVDAAAEALLELAEDMKIEAVRRLSERGASAAQLARFEEAFRTATATLHVKRAELADVCARIAGAIQRLSA